LVVNSNGPVSQLERAVIAAVARGVEVNEEKANLMIDIIIDLARGDKKTAERLIGELDR
jgi:hypothetical protein